MIEITELQRDALVEAFNIGIGQAAASLAALVQDEVKLSVLSLQLLPPDEAYRRFSFQEERKISAVSQRFTGAFNALGFLIFPEDQGLEIVRRMVGETLSLQELTELEREAMSEIGNILLNACVGTLANLFQSELQSSLPTYLLGTPEEVLSENLGSEVVLLLHLNLTLEQNHTRGYVAFLLNLDAVHQLLAQVDRFIARIGN